MDERHVAQSEIAHSRQRVGDLAEELSRRVSPDYLRDRAKEMAMQRTYEMKDRAVHSPLLFHILGAVGGWFAGSLAHRANERRSFSSGRSYGYRGDAPVFENDWARRQYEYDSYGYNTPPMSGQGEESSSSLGSKVGDLKSAVSDKASSVAERASDVASSLRERTSDVVDHARARIPSRYEAQTRASGVYHQIIQEQPLLAVCGAIALGSLAAMLLPVSDRERSMLSPAKDRVRENLNQQVQKVGSAVESKISASGNQQSSTGMGSTEGSSLGLSSPSTSTQSSETPAVKPLPIH